MNCLCLSLTGIWLCGSLFLVSPASATGADLKSATEADKATASDHYTQGMTSFQAGDAGAALEQFRLSYDAVKSPNSHLMVGKALIDLGRYLEAHQALQETLAEAKEAEALDPKYAQTRQAAEEELSRVEQQVVRLTVSVSGVGSDAKLRVNDKEYAPSELTTPIAVAPGPLNVTLLEGGESVATQTLTTTAGESLNLSLAPTPPETEAETEEQAPNPSSGSSEKKPFRHRRETAYVAAGLGAAGAITFGVFGLLNNSKFSDVEDSCNNNLCPDSVHDDAEQGHTYQTVANVGLIVGVVGLGTAVALFLTEDETPETATQLNVGPAQVSLRGSF